MAHAFTSLSLVDHDFLHKWTQDLDSRIRPVGQSKLSWSRIPTKKKFMEKSAVKRPVEIKYVVISYDIWISRKTEENFSLMAHYCTGQERKALTLG